MNTTESAPPGVKSSFMSTFRPWTTDSSVPHGPTRSGPMRRFIKAMTFISRKMFRNAIGIVITRMTVAATTNRTTPRFASTTFQIGPPKTMIAAARPTLSTMRIGSSVKTTLPGVDRRPQVRETAVIATAPRPRVAVSVGRRVQPKAAPSARKAPTPGWPRGRQ